jgi:hypothetical protein
MAANKKGSKAKGGRKKAGKMKGGGSNFPISPMIIVAVLVIGGGLGVLAWFLTSQGGDGLEIPKFAYASTAPPRAPEAYQAALDIPDYLEQIPCYCGCAVDGHQNNLDCFIKSRQGDKVEWDQHAAG